MGHFWFWLMGCLFAMWSLLGLLSMLEPFEWSEVEVHAVAHSVRFGQVEGDTTSLCVVLQLFLCGLLNLQDSGILSEVELARLFSNVQDLVRLHTALWAQVMQPALEKARQLRAPLSPIDLQPGFRTVRPIFSY